MAGSRQFIGSRGGGRVGAASELMRFEIQKKGKLPAAERYKRILKKKLEESKKELLGAAYKKPFSLSDKINPRKMSARAEAALKEIAAKKAAKLAKAERRMVLVHPRNFHNGRITAKGEIYDVEGTLVAKVNTKTGEIIRPNGWGLGKYKPKSMMTNMFIEGTIDKYSPYYIRLRQQQLLQQQGMMYGVHGPVMSQDVINVYGPVTPQANNPYGYTNTDDPTLSDRYGADAGGPRQNIGVTSWGARSDNVWGTFTDNAWGTSMDNVWGTNTTDVWGGVGAGNLWGNKGIKIFGTGSGKNYLKGITSFIAGFFGFSTKKNRERLRSLNALARSGGSAPATTRTTRTR